MTIQTAEFETLIALGAEVTWSSCKFSTRSSCCYCCCWNQVYAWKGLDEESFDWCIEQTFFGEDRKPLNMILDEGDLTNMVIDRYPELVAVLKV
jgi:adenosylhomocysteinase